MTFDEIMSFYAPHNKDTYEDMKKSYQNGRMVPFVGAGLSVFCGYLQWGDLLKKLVAYVTNKNKAAEISDLICQNKYLEAAGKIQEAYPPFMIPLKKFIPYEKIEKCERENLQKSAAYMLPLLFPDSPCVTTNFDRVLESVNETHGKKFDYVLPPDEVGQLTRTLQHNQHNLFKLHGDIGKDGMTSDKIVFTEKQYNRAYTEQTHIKDALLNWFRNSVMLFLGCSLSKDRTLDLLGEVHSTSQQGAQHFAILPCEDEEKAGSRLAELFLTYGIRPIFYPQGQHDSVQVILERLLEETNQPAYQSLMASRPRERTLSHGERFEYNADTVSFVGRTAEMEALRNFCHSSQSYSWWAITAQGGSGKSRLAYEFKNELEISGWSVYWLANYGYSNLQNFEPAANNTLVICDDVQAHMDEVYRWMHIQFRKCRSQKLRVLLIERENKKMDSVTWRKFLDDESTEPLEYQCHKEAFLELEPLQPEDLRALMADFAKQIGKIMEEETQEELLQVLQKLDKEYQRPLYALAIADAWCDGENPKNWSQTKFLKWLVKRERRYYHEKLKEVANGQRITDKHKDELDLLIAHSCITGIIPVFALPGYPTPLLDKLAENGGMDTSELLANLGLTRPVELTLMEKDGEDRETSAEKIDCEAVFFHCPDILKEYFVLELSLERKKWADLFDNQNWIESPIHMKFLGRSIRNHANYLKKQPIFFQKIFSATPKDPIYTEIYAWLLFDIAHNFKEREKDACAWLRKLYEKNSEESYVAYVYACALVNLTVEQDLAGVEQTLPKLEDLYTAYSDNEDIAVQYAKGLVNLTANQDLAGREQTLPKLEALYSAHPHKEDIAVQYAKGLYNLTVKQDLAGMELTLPKLEALYSDHPRNEDIAVQYAKGLFNLTVEQDLAGMEQTLPKLKALYSDHLHKEDIAVAYAMGLLNLTAEQDLARREQTLPKLEALYSDHPRNEDIAVRYAQGLFNLTLAQDLAGRARTLTELQSLYSKFSSNDEIVALYAGVYLVEHEGCSLAELPVEVDSKQSLAECFTAKLLNVSSYSNQVKIARHCVALARELLNLYQDSDKIILCLAQITFNVTLFEDEQDRLQTLSDIQLQLRKNPQIRNDFRQALDAYLRKHPEHIARYQCLYV